MTAALGQASHDDPESLAVRIKAGVRTLPPLFVIPGVNGNVIGYENLANQLVTDRAIYGLRSVGLSGETEPLEKLETIAERFIEDLRKVQPRGPYHFAGVCIGGMVAYEMAQQLAKQGERVALLAMIGTWPPYAVDETRPTERLSTKIDHLRSSVVRHLRALWNRPRGERLSYILKYVGAVREMVELGDVYRRDADELRRDLISDSNRRAARDYEPAPYAGDVVLILPNSIRRSPRRDARLAWRGFVQGNTTVIRLPGEDSGALIRPPYLQALVDELSPRLAASGSPNASR
jgi:thioesterase domain-containing protein